MTSKDEGNQAIVTAITINDNGKKEFIGEQIVDIESYESWINFLQILRGKEKSLVLRFSVLITCISRLHLIKSIHTLTV